jgi:iron complex outermembrane recepter protein
LLKQPKKADAAADDEKEIVVTGTLIRGIAPPGTNTVTINKEAITATGASTTAQLLQTIPQLGSFNNLQAPNPTTGNFVTTNRPNLRNFPGFTTTGSSATLMLIDGHRVVGIGTINFITRKDFKGLEVNARYGFGSNYKTFDANATAGHSWDGGNIFVSYNYSQHDAIYGRDRDFVKTFPAATGLAIPVTSLECPGGNVNVRLSADVYGLPYTSATAAAKKNVANQCDLSDGQTIFPKEHRHSVYAGLSQQLSDTLKFDMHAFYMNRQQYASGGFYHTTQLIGPAAFGLTGSPFQSTYFINPSTVPFPFELQNVSFAWGGAEAVHQDISLKTWGVSNNFTLKMGSNWQAKLSGNYSQSDTLSNSYNFNATTLTNAIKAGLFNPYAPATSDAGALAALSNNVRYGHSLQRQFDVRLIVDGDLAKLPGGAVKLALGAEHIGEGFDTQRGDTVIGAQNTGYAGLSISGSTVVSAQNRIPIYPLSRKIDSLFGEMVVPLVGADNAGGIVKELTLSAAGRYDHYSDVGNTFNPKLGLTYKPFNGLKIRASWGKSFAAPSLADDSRADPTGLNWATGGTFSFLVPLAAVTAAGYPAPAAGQNYMIVLLGAKPGLQPQKANTWSIGGDIEPSFIPGLKLNVTYWNIKYKGVIAQPPFTSTTTYFANFGNSFIINPTLAQITATQAGAVTTIGTPCAPLPGCVYIIEDDRKQNLGNFNLDGLDVGINYRRQTGFGSIDASTNLNYELNRLQSQSATAALADLLLRDASRYKFRSTLGATIGNFRSQITWNHSHGYDISPVLATTISTGQTHVASYNVIDLFFKYDVKSADLAFTLGINNVFDKAPPVYKAQQIGTPNGYANGNTVGRLVQLGVSKKF